MTRQRETFAKNGPTNVQLMIESRTKRSRSTTHYVDEHFAPPPFSVPSSLHSPSNVRFIVALHGGGSEIHGRGGRWPSVPHNSIRRGAASRCAAGFSRDFV